MSNDLKVIILSLPQEISNQEIGHASLGVLYIYISRKVVQLPLSDNLQALFFGEQFSNIYANIRKLF